MLKISIKVTEMLFVLQANMKKFCSVAALNKYTKTLGLDKIVLLYRLTQLKIANKLLCLITSSIYAKVANQFLADKLWKAANWIHDQFMELIQSLQAAKKTFDDMRNWQKILLQTILSQRIGAQELLRQYVLKGADWVVFVVVLPYWFYLKIDTQTLAILSNIS